jgi:hypothetical protein
VPFRITNQKEMRLVFVSLPDDTLEVELINGCGLDPFVSTGKKDKIGLNNKKRQQFPFSIINKTNIN